jgi:hypothetical protein
MLRKAGPSNLPWCPSDVLAWKKTSKNFRNLDFVVTVNCVGDELNFACLNYPYGLSVCDNNFLVTC